MWRADRANGLVTVDVFDTVLTRRVGEPPALFTALGRRLVQLGLTTLAPSAFARTRQTVEAHLRQSAPGGEINLLEIHRELVRRGITTGPANRLAELEMELEAFGLVAVPGMREELRRLRDRSGRLLFLSDTYLPSRWLQSALERESLWQPGDDVLVSCEMRRSKATGDAYRKIRRTETGPLLHVGDHPVIDGERARRAGFTARVRSHTGLNRYEQLLETFHEETSGTTSLLAGAARLTRLASDADSKDARCIESVTASVAGPALSSFVLWLLHRARVDELDRLYFVARDGFVLRRLATSIADVVGFGNLEICYLFGSRLAWLLPGSTDLADESPDWLTQYFPQPTARSLAARVGVGVLQVQRILRDLGLTGIALDDILDGSAIDRLTTHDGFRTLLTEAAAYQQSLAGDYLRSAGFTKPGKIGVVDLGWRGRSMAALDRIAERAGATNDRSYYFFGLVTSDQFTAPRSSHCFVADHRTGVGPRIEYESLLEVMCPADHASVRGYKRTAVAHAAPVLGEPAPPGVVKGRELIIRTLDRFGVELAAGLRAHPELITDAPASLASASHAVLTLFLDRPTAAEARTWGEIHHDPSPDNSDPRMLAAPVRVVDAVRLAASGMRGPWSESLWPAATRRRSNRSARIALRVAKAFDARFRHV